MSHTFPDSYNTQSGSSLLLRLWSDEMVYTPQQTHPLSPSHTILHRKSSSAAAISMPGRQALQAIQNFEFGGAVPSSKPSVSQEGANATSATDALVQGRLSGAIQYRLPTELWRMVFSCIAGRPKIAWSHFFRSSETTSRCPWTQMACALVLVCKSWHAMAIDLLYGDVALTSLPRACIFHLMLSSSPQKYGRLIKRISISYISEYADTDGMFFTCMSEIVSHCPRLQSITMGRNHFKPIHNWEEIMSNAASNIIELHLDDHNHKRNDWGLTLSSKDLAALSSFSNLESLTVPWPMEGIYSQDITIPRLRDLTLCIVSNVCPGLPPLSLPSLQNLTFSLQYKCFLTTEWTVPEGDLHRIFTTVLAAYGPQLRRLHLNPVDWDEGWGDLVIHNQLLLDYCPALEHFITYTINPAARASHHPMLRWIDIWISFEENEYDSDVYDDAAATCVQDDATAVCVQDAEKFPALQGCRFLDLSLSPITDLPVLASPKDMLPDDGVLWTIPPFRICQTYDMVTREDFYEYDSDSDSSFKLSPSEEDDDLMDSEIDSDSEEFSDDDDTIREPIRLSDTEPRFDIDRLAAGIVY